MEVTGHKAHGAVPEPGSVVIARVSGCCSLLTMSMSNLAVYLHSKYLVYSILEWALSCLF